jgi:RNA polymerase sigma-70 factor (ECF subfamily)
MSELRDFYDEVFVRLVGQLRLVTGSVSDAEELVQDAFVRLVPRWSTVSTYDDPEAWVRRVAMRLAVSRWRRGQVAARGLLRLAEREDVTEPDGGEVDLARALAGLPVGQRQVLVLHHVVGLPVDLVAAELGIAPGTVKSRLSRGRAALAVVLTEEVLP